MRRRRVGKIARRTVAAWAPSGRSRPSPRAICARDFAHADRPSSAPLPTLQLARADEVIE
jgi:hypothetical protein